MPFSVSAAANWNHTAEPGAMPTFLPFRSSHVSSFTPVRPMTYFGDEPTPMMPTTFVAPLESEMARSAGPTAAASSEPDSNAVRASA